jgi:hypothetical protein
MAETQSTKVLENRLRRMAERQGLQLIKSRRRDPLALDYGTYRVETVAGEQAPGFVVTDGTGLTLEEVERLLTTPREQRLTGTK